ncbi:hypothetical protein CES87_20485 [Pseudomonas sp. ERMR1:02]|nr:hypothetical protein CES87_20485 [Pseudomonas sp. ERMR1:02]
MNTKALESKDPGLFAFVGASLLAMGVNDNAPCMDDRVVGTFFASRLAPTGTEYIRGIGAAGRPSSLRCGDPTSQLPQGFGYIHKGQVGCQAA